jgi:hypothetical protein
MNSQSSSDFLKSYHEFKNSIDFDQSGFMPDLENLVWCLLMGVPEVPADKDSSPDSALVAIDQRAIILKAVFVEVNKNQPEDFLDKGLFKYDEAKRLAKKMLADGEFQS